MTCSSGAVRCGAAAATHPGAAVEQHDTQWKDWVGVPKKAISLQDTHDVLQTERKCCDCCGVVSCGEGCE